MRALHRTLLTFAAAAVAATLASGSANADPDGLVVAVVQQASIDARTGLPQFGQRAARPKATAAAGGRSNRRRTPAADRRDRTRHRGRVPSRPIRARSPRNGCAARESPGSPFRYRDRGREFATAGASVPAGSPSIPRRPISVRCSRRPSPRCSRCSRRSARDSAWTSRRRCRPCWPTGDASPRSSPT